MSISNEGAATSTPLMAHHHLRPPPTEASRQNKVGGGGAVRYMECLKNHAANIGWNATDGCGEFITGGEEGTLEALICCACDCHRNFHKKLQMPQHSINPAGVLKMNSVVRNSDLELRRRHALAEEGESSGLKLKKRFRSTFTQEQKEKMQSFAEKCGWKLQMAGGDVEVRSFCEEIGVNKKVLKVWMHNNKSQFANKIINSNES